MGYEIQLQKKILELLQLFDEHAPDPEIHSKVTELVADKTKWPRAHDLFDIIRDRALTARGDAGRPLVAKERVDHTRVAQYSFEELCLKAIYNETDTKYPFDPDSPFWIAGSALRFARKLGLPVETVITVLAPDQ